TRTDFAINGNNGFSKDGIVDVTLYKHLKADKSDKVVVKGEELSVKTAGYVNVTAVNTNGLTTDKKGQVRLNVTSAIAGNDYKVVVKHEEAKDLTITVDVKSISVDGVEVVSAPQAPVNKIFPVAKAGVEFKFTDANGAPVSIDTTDRNITLVSKPANSTLKSENFTLDVDDDGIAGVYDLEATKAFDKEGEYVIRVSLENGASATATVKAAKFDEAVRIIFVKAPTSVALGQAVEFKQVMAMDANGVTSPLTLGTDVTLSANGKAIDTFALKTDKYELKAKTDEDYIGSTITVLAKSGDFVATTEVAVVDEAMSIAYKNTAAEAGVSTSLIANVLDSNGDVTVLSSVASDVKTEVIVIDKPADAVAVATVVTDWNVEKQQAVVNFLASEAGEYKIQTIITYKVGTADKYISDIETITVGGGVNTFNDVVVISMGANSMIVNNELVKLDVAPFIENNRTMMQFNVLYVFGIDVKWVPETNSVVAEGNGTKVVMTLGSKVATVNGEEVALDVAPYVVNGRTVVPVGLITGVFDINFDFTRNADGSIADILFTK
ncbi:MAG: hypothetical protein J6J05_07555, partial [Peptococcaceae bacterium]|nr:hypothetical protein [Peptococcaceae bacterium]